MKLVLTCVSIILLCIAALYMSITYEESEAPETPRVIIYDSGYTAQARTRDGKCLEWTVEYVYPKNTEYQLKEIKTVRDFIKLRTRTKIIGVGDSAFKDCDE